MNLPPGYELSYTEETKPENPLLPESKRIRIGHITVTSLSGTLVAVYGHTIPEHQAYKIERDAWRHRAEMLQTQLDERHA